MNPRSSAISLLSLAALTATLAAQGWSQRTTLTAPAARNSHAMAYDLTRSVAVLFGGYDGTNVARGDTWEWNGTNWNARVVPVGPSARWGHGMVFDSRRSRLLMFGGFDPNAGSVADTWSWDGSAWQQLASSNSPAGRAYFGIAYDSIRGRTVVHGGLGNSNALLGDTWEFDGQNWAQVAAGSGPGVRRGPAMTFDDTRGNVVLFGGGDGTQVFSDTWTFDGSSWTQRVVAGPSGRWQAAMQHDTLCARAVLHGGSDATFANNYADSWEWNGIAWAQVATVLPGARHGAAMAFDAQRGQTVLFGGRNATSFQSDLWQRSGACSRTMTLISPAYLGRTAVFRYSVPANAAQNFGWFALTAHTTAAVPVQVPGFSVLGLSRIDLNSIFLDRLVFPDPAGQMQLPVGIPNNLSFLGLAFDVQAVDLDFRSNFVFFSSNDIETVIDRVPPVSLVELFANEGGMDTAVSGGVWSNGARPALLGGDGRHGAFNVTNGTDLGNGVYEWNVDNLSIPGSQTFNGQPVTITDGKFYFSDFIVPAGATVRFTGSSPVQLFVRGKVEVEGTIQVNGVDQVTFNCRNTLVTQPTNPVAGQLGSLGGPGGGRGGQGGDRCFGAGPLPNNNGRDGADLRLPAGHAYAASALGTGGRGSPLHPLHGLDVNLAFPVNTYTSGGVFNSNVAYGGSGGGYQAAGALAANVPVVPNVNQILPSAPVAGGIAWDPLPIPSASTSSLAHFLIGGSGGGGGGSHPFLGLAPNVATFNADRWKAGGGGTGGGGAIAIRSGRNIAVTANGRIEAKGGRGATYNGNNPNTPTQDGVSASTGPHWGIPSPGGGGSGGTVLLQASRDVVASGVIDTSGGLGSITDGILPNTGTTSLDIDNRGGNGAAGFYRVEGAGPVSVTNAANIPALVPSRHIATLRAVDSDAASGCRSLWRHAGVTLAPDWLRYEVEVDLDGNGSVDRIYSDDPQLPNSFGPATDPLGPLVMFFQGAQVDAAGNVAAGSEGPWRTFVGSQFGIGLNSDNATGFRWDLVWNRNQFPNVVVRRVSVVLRPQ